MIEPRKKTRKLYTHLVKVAKIIENLTWTITNKLRISAKIGSVGLKRTHDFSTPFKVCKRIKQNIKQNKEQETRYLTIDMKYY